MTQTFVKEFKNVDGAAYKALAVTHGLNTYPVAVYEGRKCYVTDAYRVSGGKGRGHHTRLTVHFIDDGSVQSIPAGRFNSKAKNAPIR